MLWCFMGGPVTAEEAGLMLERVELQQLGRARRLEIDKDNATIEARYRSALSTAFVRPSNARDH